MLTTARNYLRLETLHAANDAITNAMAALPVFHLYDIQDTLHSVVYTTAADNSLNPKTHYNVSLTPSSAGALPWYQPSFSTNSVSWRWCASS